MIPSAALQPPTKSGTLSVATLIDETKPNITLASDTPQKARHSVVSGIHSPHTSAYAGAFCMPPRDPMDNCNCGNDVVHGDVWSKAGSGGGTFYHVYPLLTGTEMQGHRSIRVSFSWRAEVQSCAARNKCLSPQSVSALIAIVASGLHFH